MRAPVARSYSSSWLPCRLNSTSPALPRAQPPSDLPTPRTSSLTATVPSRLLSMASQVSIVAVPSEIDTARISSSTLTVASPLQSPTHPALGWAAANSASAMSGPMLPTNLDRMLSPLSPAVGQAPRPPPLGYLSRGPICLQPPFVASGIDSASASQTSGEASDGMRQSPRGERAPPEPTLGPSGTQSRLNWLAKKRCTNTSSQRRSSASG